MISKRSVKKSISIILSIIMLLSMMATMNFTVLASETQEANLVSNGDMEDGINWWHNNGGGTLTSVTEVKHSGDSSIKIEGRSNSWQGVAQNLKGNPKDDVIAGADYHGSAWVMFNGEAAPDTVDFKLSIKRITSEGKDAYDTIAEAKVMKGKWTLLEGDYEVPSDTDLSKDFQIYIETTGEDAEATDEGTKKIDFYADDVSLIPANPSASSEKLVALTFDDGPDNELTALVLDKLDHYKVPATFMMIGSKINETTKEIVQRVVESGHEIGNHSWGYSSMDKMAAEEIKKSVNDTTAAIEQYSGTTPKFFRPPNLATSATMFEAIDMPFVSGVIAFDWQNAYEDKEKEVIKRNATAEERAKFVLDGVKDGSIVLMHDVQPKPHPTPEALDIIIPTLLEQGYKFVTLSELFRLKGVEPDINANKMYDRVVGDTPATPGKDIIINGSFENGTEGWKPRVETTVLQAVYDVKHSGETSLKVTGRKDGWHGPAQNIVDTEKGNPVAGKSYNASAWVMFNGETVPDTMEFKLSVQWNDGTEVEGQESNHWDNIVKVNAIKGEWTKLEGTYTIPEEAVFEKGMDLYVETSEGEGTCIDFYVDDVSFQEEESIVSLNGSDSLFTDFENGDVSGWTNRGEEKISVTQDVYNSGSYSISVTGRTQNWNGPKHTLMGVVNYNKAYQISGYVMYNDGSDTQEFKMSIEKKSEGEDTQYINIGSVTASKGKWSLIEAEHTVEYDPELTEIALYFETAEGVLIDFYLDDVKVTGGDALDYDPNLTALRSVWDQYFPVGAAITPAMTESPIYSAYISKHYASVTAENCMKMDAIQPTEGNFTFEDSDKIVDFAKKNNMLVRAHTLLWHNQVSDWFFTDPEDSTKPATSEKLLERLKTHIETFMTRYNGKIDTYDVVNEVFSDGEGLRDSKWRTIVGDVDNDGIDDDYILAAFKYAYETANKIGDDNVKLCINDYSLESNGRKLDAMYNTVKRILDSGIPKERLVVGFQMHINNYSPSMGQIKRSIDKFADLGVKVQVTELDISIYRSNDEPTKATTQDVLQLQAKRYKDLFDIFKEQAEKGIMDTVTLWGTDDAMTWLHDHPVEGRTDAPLLFNKRLQAKPAYTALVNPESLPVYKQQMNAYKGTPVIGAEIDKLWSLFKPETVSEFVYGSEGATASIKTIWDNDNLYILAQVDDITKSENDSIEIFLDVNPDTNEDNKHYTVKSDNTAIEGIVSYTARDDSGYIVQVALPIDGLNLTLGSTIGIDFKVNDYNEEGKLTSTVVWNDYKNQLGTDTSGYGFVYFDKESKFISVKYGTPVVDGAADSVWSSVYASETGVWVNGTSGATAEFKTLWDENYLYVMADVTDSLLTKVSSNAHEQDSVEIFIDQNNAKTTYYEDDDYQIRINFDNEISYNPKELAGFVSATSKTDKGYIVEAAIPFTAVEAKEGAVLGFDLQVNNDEDGDGTRDSTSIWCDPTGNSWRDVSGLGNILLTNEKAATPAPTPTPTKKPGSGSSGGGGGGSSSTPAPETTPETPTPDTTEKPSTPVPVASDIAGHWAEEFIKDMISKGIVAGYEDGTIRPDKNISRAELAVVIVRALGLEPSDNAKVDFADASSIPSWAAGYIALAKENGILKGYEDNTFRADRECTREEAVTMIIQAFKLGESDNELKFSDVKDVQQWSYKFIAKATEVGLVEGYPDNTFRPGKNVTRAELFTILSNGLKK